MPRETLCQLGRRKVDLTSPEGKTKLNQRLPRNPKIIPSLRLPRNKTKLYQHLPSVKTIPYWHLPSIKSLHLLTHQLPIKSLDKMSFRGHMSWVIQTILFHTLVPSLVRFDLTSPEYFCDNPHIVQHLPRDLNHTIPTYPKRFKPNFFHGFDPSGEIVLCVGYRRNTRETSIKLNQISTHIWFCLDLHLPSISAITHT